MANDQDFQRSVTKFLHRKKWSDIKTGWLGYVQKIDPVGSPPVDELADSINVSEIPNKLIARIQGEIINVESDFVRTFILREAIFSLHKAANIISGAENGVKTGYKTWSLVNAYHGAFLAAKSILSFHGFTACTLKVENKDALVLVDCWPSLIQPPSKRKELGISNDKQILYSKSVISKFDQRHYWMVLHRAFSVMTFDHGHSANTIKLIRGIDFKSYGKQRNRLFYSSNSWNFGDLHQFVIDNDFGIVNSNFVNKFRIKENDEDSDFSVGIALILLDYAFKIFSDIAASANILAEEHRLLSDYVQSVVYHPLLHLSNDFD